MEENIADDSPQAWDPSTSTWFLMFHMANPLLSPLESWTLHNSCALVNNLIFANSSLQVDSNEHQILGKSFRISKSPNRNSGHRDRSYLHIQQHISTHVCDYVQLYIGMHM